MSYQPIRFEEKFARFHDHWAPRVIAEMNDYQFKLVRIQGEFVWHRHDDTDEAFIVIDGRMRIAFRDGHVDLGPGEMFVVPRGVEHRPVAKEEVWVMLFEPASTLNTGHLVNERTRQELSSI